MPGCDLPFALKNLFSQFLDGYNLLSNTFLILQRLRQLGQ